MESLCRAKRVSYILEKFIQLEVMCESWQESSQISNNKGVSRREGQMLKLRVRCGSVSAENVRGLISGGWCHLPRPLFFFHVRNGQL